MTDLDLSVLLSDQYELEMVLVNLATNACDAMPDGGTLTFEATRAKVGVIEFLFVGSKSRLLHSTVCYGHRNRNGCRNHCPSIGPVFYN